MNTSLKQDSSFIPDIKVLPLQFCLSAKSRVTLPAFLGSTLRGAFGTALKEVVCCVPHRDCERCWFYEACAYPYIFETPNIPDLGGFPNHTQLRGQKEVEHPFILRAPQLVPKQTRTTNNRRLPNLNDAFSDIELEEGDEIFFEILMIGTAVHYWQQVLVAVRILADTGLGENRVSFELSKAEAPDLSGNMQVVYDKDNQRISAYGICPLSLRALIDNRLEHLNISDRLRLCFISPTRIRNDNDITPVPDFQMLIKKMRQRIEHLAALHCEPPVVLDLRENMKGADEVQIIESNTQAYEWEQYSNNQGKKVMRRVFVGEIEYAGKDIRRFLPFLIAGEILHIGNVTNYGAGRYVILG